APNAGWLAQSGIEVDAKGFICAEPLAGNGRYPFQTSMSGVFAVGDVRSGSVKRVAAAVGKGSQVVATLHAWLAREGVEKSKQEPRHGRNVRAPRNHPGCDAKRPWLRGVSEDRPA